LDLGGIYMTTTKKIVVGLLLIVVGVLIGHGVGQMLSVLIGKSVESGISMIGLGIGVLAAVYIMVWKK
jgi:hypothetical protein